MTHRFVLFLLLGLAGLGVSCSPASEGSVDARVVVTTSSSAAITTSTTTSSTSTTTTTIPSPEPMLEIVGPDGITEDRLLVRLVPEVLGDRLRPLVVVLHGYAGIATNAIDSGLRDAAARGGWVVLAASGLTDDAGNQYWNATSACCDRDHRQNDDVGYLRQIIENARAQYPIDPSRVVVVGGSNGGFMAYQLACRASDVVSAIVVVAATEANSEQACEPQYPVSVFHVHGTDDLAVKFGGGELSVLLGRVAPYPSAEETVRRWSRRNGCPTEEPTPEFKVGAVRGSWFNCALGTTIQFAWLEDGHNTATPPWLAADILEFIGRQVRAPTRPIR